MGLKEVAKLVLPPIGITAGIWLLNAASRHQASPVRIRFAHARQRVDGFHFDVAAFPTERLSAWERLWCHYST